MKRASFTIAGVIIVLLSAFAQMSPPVSRDAYRNAYRSWRQSAASLERDASTGGPALAARAGQVAEQAKNYGVERSAFLLQMAGDVDQKLAWLETPPGGPPPDLAAVAAAHVNASMAAVQRNISTFATDPDAGIQQVRMMLERESLALSALSAAIADRQKLAEAVTVAAAAAAQTQTNALGKYREVMAAFKQATEETDREMEAWAEYYHQLADGAGSVPVETPSASPAESTPAAAAAPEPAAPRDPASAIPPAPLIRYTGEWTFPSVNGLSHGAPPETLDMTVTEEGGFVKGTLSARFKPRPGSQGDPVLRFTFSGDFRNSHNQVFPLETSDGVQGRIELIPGSAFNLLEINFLTDPSPGKVRQANVVLVKK